MKTPESYEKKAIKSYLDRIGAWHCCPYMAGFGKAGVPDILACYRGHFLAIEVKREGKRPTPLQTKRMAEILECYGVVMWGTADKVIKEIEEWIATNAKSSKKV